MQHQINKLVLEWLRKRCSRMPSAILKLFIGGIEFSYLCTIDLLVY